MDGNIEESWVMERWVEFGSEKKNKHSRCGGMKLDRILANVIQMSACWQAYGLRAGFLRGLSLNLCETKDAVLSFYVRCVWLIMGRRIKITTHQ